MGSKENCNFSCVVKYARVVCLNFNLNLILVENSLYFKNWNDVKAELRYKYNIIKMYNVET